MSWKVFIILFFLPMVALAQEPPKVDHPPVETIPPGDDKIVSIKKGDKAPYDGQLFSVDTSIRWGNWLQQYRYRLHWDVTFEQNVCEKEKTYRDSILVIEKDRAKKVEKSLQDGLLKSETARAKAEDAVKNPPWYSSVELGVGLGVLGTVGVLALSIWALETRDAR